MHYHYSLVMLISNVRIRSKSGYRISSKLHDKWWRFHVLVITRPFRLKTHSDAKMWVVSPGSVEPQQQHSSTLPLEPSRRAVARRPVTFTLLVCQSSRTASDRWLLLLSQHIGLFNLTPAVTVWKFRRSVGQSVDVMTVKVRGWGLPCWPSHAEIK